MEWPILAGLPAEDVSALLAIARRRTFRRREVVFHAGDPGDALHLVRTGRFAVRALTPRGEVAIVHVVGPGQAFGEISLLLPDHERSATVEALEPATTFSIVRSEFTRLHRQHPGVGLALASILADGVRRLTSRVLVAHYLDASGRVRWALAELAEMYAMAGDDAVAVPMIQEQVAELAGTSRATVNRVLRTEQRQGAIELRRGLIIVLDGEALRRRARL